MIRISGFSGNASDALHGYNYMQFSTKDKDNDEYGQNCAVRFTGAWWYKACHSSTLNGQWGNKNYAQGLTWAPLTGSYDGVNFTEMKIRQRKDQIL